MLLLRAASTDFLRVFFYVGPFQHASVFSPLYSPPPTPALCNVDIPKIQVDKFTSYDNNHYASN